MKHKHNQRQSRSLTIVFSRLGTGAGAEGTLTDWAKAIGESGGDCDILIGRSTLWQRLRLSYQIRSFVGDSAGRLAISPLCRLVDLWVSPSIYFSDFAVGKMRRWTSLRFLLDIRRVRSRRMLRRARKILVGNVVSPRGLKELAFASNSAELLLHHNGSPTDFSAEWEARRSSQASAFLGDSGFYFSDFSSAIFQSEAHQESFFEMFPDASLNTLLVWPSCNERAAREGVAGSHPYKAENLNLVGVGKFQHAKGQLQILKAFLPVSQKYPKSHLTLLGGSIEDASYLRQCKEFVELNNLSSKVSFLGYRHDALRYVAYADVFVHLSIGDGVSRAVREAAFLAKPMVISLDSGNKSFLGNGSAVFVDPLRINKVYEAISLLADSSQLRSKYSRAASDAYLSKSSWPRFVEKVRKVLDD